MALPEAFNVKPATFPNGWEAIFNSPRLKFGHCFTPISRLVHIVPHIGVGVKGRYKVYLKTIVFIEFRSLTKPIIICYNCIMETPPHTTRNLTNGLPLPHQLHCIVRISGSSVPYCGRAIEHQFEPENDVQYSNKGALP